MKKFNKIWLGLFISALVLSGCDSLLDVKSERFVLPEDHLVNTTNEALYGTAGIFSELNNIAERYVLLGELRGDLLSLSENADYHLQEINDFNCSANNPFIDVKDYYSIINNCNYLIQNIDTSVIERAEKVLYRDYAAVKAIRAWTYMQLALNFGKVIYTDKPILSLTEANAEYPEYTMNELSEILIQDLLPWRTTELPEGLSMGVDVHSSQLFFPVRFVLGDLYLWKGEYEKAAQEYYDLIYENEYIIDEGYQSYWVVENNAFQNSIYINWRQIFDYNEYENITLIAGSMENGEGSLLDSLASVDYYIMPSAPAIQNFESQTYYHNANVSRDGDLRGGPNGSYIDYSWYVGNAGSSLYDIKLITKFSLLTSEDTKAIIIYRIGLLYLRYAEAVNRAGKPNLAFASLKNGLNASTMRVDSIVPPAEKYGSYIDSVGVFVSYANFEDVMFNSNIGVHARGCGNVDLAKDYKIPELGSLTDSIEYVENLIVTELALETAFEGNRFHDLMRVALRRNNPSFLADKVAAKHSDNKEAIRAKLQVEANWYLPTK